MKRIKKVFTVVHIVLWVIFSLLVALQLSQDDTNWFYSTVGFILTCLFVFYCHFLLLTRYSGKKKDRSYYLPLVAVTLTGPLLFMLLREENANNLGYYSMALVTIVPIFLLLSWLARLTENLVLNTIRKEQLEKQAVEAELYYLKSQINPHFLFNTLNNIHTLVYKQAATAPEAVLRLSSLMRYMIYESNAHTVPLSRELSYLQDYMELHQLRYKNSPVAELQVNGNTDACHIAPLLFIHVLENAYKHSPARLETGGIKVHVDVKENNLTFRIQNPIAKKAGNVLEEPGGIGLPNVRKRLALLYPAQHELDVSSTDNVFIVTLKIHGLHLQAHERETQLLYN